MNISKNLTHPSLPIWKFMRLSKKLTATLTLLLSIFAAYSQNPASTLLSISNIPSASTYNKAGDVIDYTILIKNTGTITVFNMKVTDPNAVIDITPVASLLPGESITVSASHAITQSDLDVGKVVNVAKVSGFDPSGNPIEKSGNKTLILGLQHPELSIIAATSAQSFKNEGDLIVYTVVVKNTGNVTMNNIGISDDNARLDFGGSIGSIAPGAIDSVKAEYRVTPDDINAGKVINSGVVQAFNVKNQLFLFRSNEVTVRTAIENFNLGNYPNPVVTETTIVFDLPEKRGGHSESIRSDR